MPPYFPAQAKAFTIPNATPAQGYEEFQGGAQNQSEAGTPFWGTHPLAWDTVRLAGLVLPGICKVKAKTKNRVDKKSVPGSHGQTFTHIGYDPASVEIHVRVWTPDHLQRLAEVVPLIRPRRTAPQPVDIMHPSLTILDIQSIEVMEVTALERDEATDSYTFTIQGLEYVSKGNQPAQVNTAKTSVGLENHQLQVAPLVISTLTKQGRRPRDANTGP